MGNTLTLHTQDLPAGNKELYNSSADKQNTQLQKTVQEILLDRKEIIQGRELYVNRRKAYCRIKQAGKQFTLYDGDDLTNMTRPNDYVSVNIAGIVNTLPDFIDVENIPDVDNTSTIISTIGTFNVNLKVNDIQKNRTESNYQENVNGKLYIQPDLYNATTCDKDIADICAKQLYNNKCIIYDEAKGGWVLDNNNKKIGIVKEESLVRV